jgi:hypothetical protein
MTQSQTLHPARTVAAFGEGIWAKMKPASFILAKVPNPRAAKALTQDRQRARLCTTRHVDPRFQKMSPPCA